MWHRLSGGRFTSSSRGMSLIEITVTVAIIMLASAIVIPSVGNLFRANMRATAAKLAGTIRATYDSAALSGQHYRLVFVFNDPVVNVEVGQERTTGGAGLLGFAALLSGAGASGGSLDERERETEQVEPPKDVMKLFMGKDAHDTEDDVGGMISFSSAGQSLDLGKGVRLLDVWLEGMRQPANEGTVYLPFYPHGYTHKAIIHLTDDDGTIFSIVVKGVTGQTEIDNKYVEVPK